MNPTAPSQQDRVDWNHQVAVEMNQLANQFDFFQAIRRVETLSQELPRVGHAQQANQEAVRIKQSPAVDFAPSTIDEIEPDSSGRVVLKQRFFGLLGPSGPMPLHVTEQVRNQTRHEDDATIEQFLNLFHHRMGTLFYRAWSSSRGAVQRDRPDQDRFADYLAALSGVMANQDAAETPPTSAVTIQNRWHFTGRFASSHRNAEGLQAVVSSVVDAKTQVYSFVLRQLRLQEEDRTRLTKQPTAAGRGGRLGRSVVLGRSVADRRSTIGLCIGPVKFQLFRALLPGGQLHDSIRKLIRSYIDPSLACQVRLILDRTSVPRMSLGREGALGQNAWMFSSAPRTDLGDCQYMI